MAKEDVWRPTCPQATSSASAQEFPASIAQFKNLVSLNLADNELRTVPGSIAIPTLIKLDLSNNKSVPRGASAHVDAWYHPGSAFLCSAPPILL